MTHRRFARTELLVGREAMECLYASHVVVAGLGAVGSYAVEALARAGIGRLTLVDFDVVRPSNINRQLYALDSTVGADKTRLAVERVRDINPDCEVRGLKLFIDAETARQVVDLRPNFVIDAIDSVGPKVELLAACAAAGCDVVSAMGAATRCDYASLRVGDISETSLCPLAKWVRKGLRKRGVGGGIACVYSVEPARQPSLDPEPDEQSLQRGRARRPLGSLSYMTGIFGLVAAGHVIMTLARRGGFTSGGAGPSETERGQ